MIKQEALFDNKRTVILTLKNEYWQQILVGEKKHEFRFKFPLDDVTAYIYIPTPVKKIVGVIELTNTQFMKIDAVSKFYQKEYKLPYKEMYDWVFPREGCYMSEIEQVSKFKLDIEYAYLKSFYDFVAPQQYTYIDNKNELRKFLMNQKIMNL